VSPCDGNEINIEHARKRTGYDLDLPANCSFGLDPPKSAHEVTGTHRAQHMLASGRHLEETRQKTSELNSRNGPRKTVSTPLGPCQMKTFFFQIV
jgi:hypothetical protein